MKRAVRRGKGEDDDDKVEALCKEFEWSRQLPFPEDPAG